MMGEVPDVNVLLAFLNSEDEQHYVASAWLRSALLLNVPVRIPHEVAVACVRLAANPRVVSRIIPFGETFASIDRLLMATNVELLAPNERSWTAFGNGLPVLRGYRQVPDAHLAALAIANGYRLVTFDRGFIDHPGLEVELLTL